MTGTATRVEAPTIRDSQFGIGAPEIGSAQGWPLVLYFHRVVDEPSHYTEISRADLETAIDLVRERFRMVDASELTGGRDEVLRRMYRPDGPPRCIITFDDGYRDNLTAADPLLRERGVTGVFFVITEAMGRRDRRGAFLRWEDAEALLERGHVVASHSESHRAFDSLNAPAAEQEVLRSHDIIQRELGSAAPLFAYPYGRFPLSPPRCLDDFLTFGTVRSTPRPWWNPANAIRRTYLPAFRTDLWPELVDLWAEA